MPQPQFDGSGGGELLVFQRLLGLTTRSAFLLNDVLAEANALAADADAWASDELVDIGLRFTAEGAPQRAVQPLRCSTPLQHAKSIELRA